LFFFPNFDDDCNAFMILLKNTRLKHAFRSFIFASYIFYF
jgi:hypothetical protein